MGFVVFDIPPNSSCFRRLYIIPVIGHYLSGLAVGTIAVLAMNCCVWPALRPTFAGMIVIASGVREMVALAASMPVLAIIAMVCGELRTGGAT